MNEDHQRAREIGNKIVNVLLHAMATIEDMELTDDELAWMKDRLKQEKSRIENSWIFDPTFAMYHGKQAESDVAMGLSRIALMRELKRHWKHDGDRLKQMRKEREQSNE